MHKKISKKRIFLFSAVSTLLIAAVLFWHIENGFGSAVTIAEVRQIYDSASTIPQSKLRVLVVPGHEPRWGGTSYRGVNERDMAAELGKDLQEFLNNDPRYEAMITRDNKDWSPAFLDYFKTNWSDIDSWIKFSKNEQAELEKIGVYKKVIPKVAHNDLVGPPKTRLYGITKWSNENNIDLMIHIHFNNYRAPKYPGKYTGFVMYVPEQQYSNSVTTHAIAESVFGRLSKYNPVANLPVESDGLIDDPTLIAVGSYNTSDAASMLIEYGYIYEPEYQDLAIRKLVLKDLAYQTYLGLQDFFLGPTSSEYVPSNVYDWNDVNDKNIYAVQTALMMAGEFPPGGDRNRCLHTGKLDACTKEALLSFQEKNGIMDEKGEVGPRTRYDLWKIYNLKEQL